MATHLFTVSPPTTHVFQITPDSKVSYVGVAIIGPAGPSAGAAGSHEYVQSTPLASHVINHSLDFKPNVDVLDYVTGEQIAGKVIYHSDTQVEVKFNYGIAIRAFLS